MPRLTRPAAGPWMWGLMILAASSLAHAAEPAAIAEPATLPADLTGDATTSKALEPNVEKSASGEVVRERYENRKLKFINADEDPVPDDVIYGAIRRLRPAWRRPAYEHLTKMGWKPGDYGSSNTLAELIDKSDKFIRPDWLHKALTEELESRGYDGLIHEGGSVTAGTPHEVKVYWNADRDISLRAEKFRFPQVEAPPPVVGDR